MRFSVSEKSPQRRLAVAGALGFGIILHIAVAAIFWLSPDTANPQIAEGAPFMVEVATLAAPRSSVSDVVREQEQQETTPAREQKKPHPVAPPVTSPVPPVPEAVSEAVVEQSTDTESVAEPEKPHEQREPEAELQEAEVTEAIEDIPEVQAESQPQSQASSQLSLDAPQQSNQLSAPAEGMRGQQALNAEISWQAVLQAHLERNKRYPRQSQLLRQQGIPMVTFTMDRSGSVLSVRLHRSSGIALLDEEALALIKRAVPLPLPPPEVVGDILTLTVPVEFALGRKR